MLGGEKDELFLETMTFVTLLDLLIFYSHRTGFCCMSFS